MAERDAASRHELEVTAPAPWLQVVRGAPIDEEWAQRLATSRRAGSIVVRLDAATAREPDAFAAVVEDAPPVEVEFERVSLVVHVPVGRGRVVDASRADAAQQDALVQRLAASDGRKAFESAVDAALEKLAVRASSAWRTEVEPSATTRTAARTLFPADSIDVAAFGHTIVGGEFVTARDGGRPLVGRLARGRESFELAAQNFGRAGPAGGVLRRAQLVLVRWTARSDAGALLRVELDDEDLGPWRLCDGVDIFPIASDLLAGRDRFRVVVTPIASRAVGSFRWDFLQEREPDGLWLLDLERVHAPARPESATTTAAPTRSADRRLDLAAGVSTRGLELHAGERVEFVLPRGWSRLRASIERASVATARSAAADVVVLLDGEEAARVATNDARAPSTLDVGIAGARSLTLSCETTNERDVVVWLAEPELVRGESSSA